MEEKGKTVKLNLKNILLLLTIVGIGMIVSSIFFSFYWKNGFFELRGDITLFILFIALSPFLVSVVAGVLTARCIANKESVFWTKGKGWKKLTYITLGIGAGVSLVLFFLFVKKGVSYHGLLSAIKVTIKFDLLKIAAPFLVSVVVSIIEIMYFSPGVRNRVFSIKTIGLLCAVALVVIVFVWKPWDGQDTEEMDKYNALAIAESKVEAQLKAPSTAEFCSISEADISQKGDTWTVRGWVDAQNGFGAMIRNKYTVVIVEHGDSYSVESVLIY